MSTDRLHRESTAPYPNKMATTHDKTSPDSLINNIEATTSRLKMSENRVLCDTCGRTYASKTSLRVHVKSQFKSAPYKCCEKGFCDKTQLTRHRCNSHAADKKHECATCPQTFGAGHDLNRHIKNVHEEKRLSCPDCTKCFADRGAYDDHKAGHNGEKTHICQCGKAYVYATGLSRHKRKCRK